ARCPATARAARPKRGPGGQGPRPASPVARPPPPPPPRAERELCAAHPRPWQPSDFGAKDHETLVPAAIAQARDRCRADVDRRERRVLLRARGLFLFPEYGPTAAHRQL